jgi:hypothetical protein
VRTVVVVVVVVVVAAVGAWGVGRRVCCGFYRCQISKYGCRDERYEVVPEARGCFDG